MSATFLDWVQLSTLLALQSDTCRVWNMNMNVCVGRYTEYGYCCCRTFVAVLKQLSQSFSSLRILNLPSWKMKGQRSQPKQVSCQNFALKVKPSPVMTWTRHRCIPRLHSHTADLGALVTLVEIVLDVTWFAEQFLLEDDVVQADGEEADGALETLLVPGQHLPGPGTHLHTT